MQAQQLRGLDLNLLVSSITHHTISVSAWDHLHANTWIVHPEGCQPAASTLPGQSISHPKELPWLWVRTFWCAAAGGPQFHRKHLLLGYSKALPLPSAVSGMSEHFVGLQQAGCCVSLVSHYAANLRWEDCGGASWIPPPSANWKPFVLRTWIVVIARWTW